MTTLKTTLNERPATDTPFTPTATVAASNVQDAIEEVVALVGGPYQPLDADLTSWAGVTRAAGFDTFTATPSSANLASLVTGETGSGALMFGTSPSVTTDIRPASNDGASLGISGTAFSDLFLASGGVINWAAGDVTVTHSSTMLTSTGRLTIQNGSAAGSLSIGADLNASTVTNLTRHIGRATMPAYDTSQVPVFIWGVDANGTDNNVTIGGQGGSGAVQAATNIIFITGSALNTAGGTLRSVIDSSGHFRPWTNDGAQLGISGTGWSDLFLASGGVINFNSGDVTITHASNALTFAGGDYNFDGVVDVASNTATPAGGSTSARLLFGTTAGFGIYYGSGAPTVSAAQGSLYMRSDGAINARLYINTNGSTTWTAFNTTS